MKNKSQNITDAVFALASCRQLRSCYYDYTKVLITEYTDRKSNS